MEFQKFPCHHGSERAVWQEWRKTKVEGEEDLSACVSLCRRLLRSILARLYGPKPTGLAAASLRVYNQSRHRQTAAIKPRLFQVHRVWKGLIEGLWSQWGWSFSPSLPPSRWKVEGGGGLGRRGCCRHHVTHVSCRADQNGIWTKTHHLLLPATGWQPLVPTQRCHPQRQNYRYLPSYSTNGITLCSFCLWSPGRICRSPQKPSTNLFLCSLWEESILLNSIVFSLIVTYQHSDEAGTAPIGPLLWPTRGTVASCKAYLFKSIPIKEPFGLNTLDKDQGGQGSSPVELFTCGQRASALFSLELPPSSNLEKGLGVSVLMDFSWYLLVCFLFSLRAAENFNVQFDLKGFLLMLHLFGWSPKSYCLTFNVLKAPVCVRDRLCLFKYYLKSFCRSECVSSTSYCHFGGYKCLTVLLSLVLTLFSPGPLHKQPNLPTLTARVASSRVY